MRRDAVMAGTGLLGLLPALILVTTGLADLNAPKALVHPVWVMGGLALALVSSLVAALRWSIQRGPEGIRISCMILNRRANLIVLLLGLALLAVITGYLFVENFTPRIECP